MKLISRLLRTRKGIPFSPITSIDTIYLNDGNKIDEKLQKISGINLLDNADFSIPVNQRGTGTYTAAGYTIDRWLKDAAGTVSIPSGVLNLTRTDSTSQHYFYQRMEKAKVKIGGYYTLTIGLSDGTTYTLTNSLSFSVSELATPFGRITFVMMSNFVQILIDYSKSSINVLFIKFEPGRTYTAFTPKGYAVELVECRRYLQRVFYAMRLTTNTIGITFDPPMRVAPTLVFNPYAADAVPTPLSVGIYGGWLTIPGDAHYNTGNLMANAEL